MDTSDLVSIIIPAYNVEMFVEATLASAVNQTHKNLEIVVVEDSSTDGTKDIVERFALEDNRIKVIYHTTNQGVSISRKEGVMASHGKYVMFLDGDDEIEYNACESLVAKILEFNVDILQFGTKIRVHGNVSKSEVDWFENFSRPHQAVITGKYILNTCFVEKKFGFTLWNKIYCGDLVRKAFTYYPDERFDMAEDLHAAYLILYFAQSYYGIPDVYHKYNFGCGITGGQSITLKRMNLIARQGRILKHILRFIDEVNDRVGCDESYAAIRDQFLADCWYNWMLHCGHELRAKAFPYFVENFAVTDLLGLAADYQINHNYITQKVIAESLVNCPHFQNRQKSVKTVAMYYFRLNNGGIEKVMSMLSKILINAGYRVVLLTDEKPSDDDYYVGENVNRVILGKEPKTLEDFRHRFFMIESTIQQYQIDVVIYHAWVSPLLLWDLITVKLLGASFLVHTHNVFSQGLTSSCVQFGLQTLSLPAVYRLGDGVISLTEIDKNWWEMCGLNVYYTKNPLQFDISTIKPSFSYTKNILWIGRISPEKQPEDALKILKVVRKQLPDTVLHIVGKADDQEYWRKFCNSIQELGLQEAVILHGFHKDVGSFYASSALMLCTSLYEGFLLTLAESKVYGVPSVIYNLTNLDMVREGRGMRIVAQGDIKAAADEVIYLLQNDIERRNLGIAARESAEVMYKFDVLSNWKKIFISIAEKKNGMNLNELVTDTIDILCDHCTIGLSHIHDELAFYQNGSFKQQEASDFYKGQAESFQEAAEFFKGQAESFQEAAEFYRNQVAALQEAIDYYKSQVVNLQEGNDYYAQQMKNLQEGLDYYKEQTSNLQSVLEEIKGEHISRNS